MNKYLSSTFVPREGFASDHESNASNVLPNISFRFFTNPRSGQPENPPPGTVVDDVVTLPERHDFFLISQSVRQGTVNPTSYNIIHNESALSPDILQRLTYKVSFCIWYLCAHAASASVSALVSPLVCPLLPP